MQALTCVALTEGNARGPRGQRADLHSQLLLFAHGLRKLGAQRARRLVGARVVLRKVRALLRELPLDDLHLVAILLRPEPARGANPNIEYRILNLAHCMMHFEH